MTPSHQRLQSLDAFRGFIMLLMASSGFGLAEMAKAQPDTWWTTAGWMVSHVEWVGCSPWDLIQPAFMFMVGIAVPYSYLKRAQHGQGFFGMSWHALTRAIALILLGVFLSSRSGSQTTWIFTNVLSQIGLGYFFLFLYWRLGREFEISAILVILVGYWTYFYLHPMPEGGIDLTTWNLQAGEVLGGIMEPWSKHVNAAADFDRWFLNLFPREQPFETHPGGYQTLNFIPSLATMIGGSLTGRFLMRPDRSEKMKLVMLIGAGVLLLFLGTMLGLFVCPLVKRIWTPSWALFSGGWVLLMLAAFYWVVEIWGWRKLAFPLVVVGMNSIFIYLMHSLSAGWIKTQLKMHLPATWFDHSYAPIAEKLGVLIVLWLLCLWLYRQKAFLKL
jgi:heparan-alpha-glucosaminide N-acetyltransferase